MAACGQGIDGGSKEKFDSSRAKMEDSLNGNEKENLEKAFRVIALEAMREAFNSEDESATADNISLKMVDGKTYEQLVEMAENSLKKENEKNKEKIKTKLLELEEVKISFEKAKQAIKLSNVVIEKIDWFSEPALELTFSYRFERAGKHAVTLRAKNNATNEVMAGVQVLYENVAEGEEDNNQVILTKARLANEKFTKKQIEKIFKAKFPIPQSDFPKYDIGFQIYSYQSEEKDEFDENLYAEEKNELESRLKELEEIKGTLDELEITK